MGIEFATPQSKSRKEKRRSAAVPIQLEPIGAEGAVFASPGRFKREYDKALPDVRRIHPIESGGWQNASANPVSSCNLDFVTRKHLHEARQDYPDAANEIEAWVAIVKEVRWHNFPEVRGTFKDADNVKGYVIFNIRQNRYRLVTVIHYARTTKESRTKGHVYIRSFLTHKEYNNPANWDRRFGTK